MARYIENLNSCTDPVSGDYLWIVDASAGSTDKDRKVDIAKFGIVSATTTWTPVLLFGTGNTGMAGTFTGTSSASNTPWNCPPGRRTAWGRKSSGPWRKTP